MKRNKLQFSLVIILFLMVFCLACGGGQSNDHSGHEHTEEVHGEGKEFTSDYICPMHCSGSGSDEAGKCPVCGMDYVAQAEHTKDGHKHN